ncbi:bone morphogenetic protein receptor, type II a (serine/threonine kinase) isoform X1, partial [Silurus asotus]
LLSICFLSPPVNTDRACVFLACSQNNECIQRAGNICGLRQNCARTDFCMGYFKLDSGNPTPVLLGCSINQAFSPNLTCNASIHFPNFIGSVCNLFFCNMNITWNQQGKQYEYKQPWYSSVTTVNFILSLFILDVKCAILVIIPAGALILLFSFIIVLKWKFYLKCCNTSYNDLGKHLEIQKVVACNHFATVWRGTFKGFSVAIKVFPTARQREFTKEKHVYKLPLMMHSGIVRFLVDGKIGNEFLLVLELATHGSLNAFLTRTVCDWACMLKLAQTLSQGLAYLHTDLKMNGVYKPAVAHCDLSSSNVLVRADGSCALCDFGSAIVLQHQPPHRYTHILKDRVQMCTLQYLAPEILEGCANLNSSYFLLQADVYSLGLLLWEILMRCSDLCTGSPVPVHMLPYETEMGHSPSLDELLIFVMEKRLRPTIPHFWAGVSSGLALHELLEDCWDHDADARLTAACVANRLASL